MILLFELTERKNDRKGKFQHAQKKFHTEISSTRVFQRLLLALPRTTHLTREWKVQQKNFYIENMTEWLEVWMRDESNSMASKARENKIIKKSLTQLHLFSADACHELKMDFIHTPALSLWVSMKQFSSFDIKNVIQFAQSNTTRRESSSRVHVHPPSCQHTQMSRHSSSSRALIHDGAALCDCCRLIEFPWRHVGELSELSV